MITGMSDEHLMIFKQKFSGAFILKQKLSENYLQRCNIFAVYSVDV
jgi:hypothetical protein